MREILFRGKRIDNGEWVEGSFLRDGEAHMPVGKEGLPFSDCYIVPKKEYDNVRTYLTQGILLNTVAYRIIPGSVGQCTGLNDKNGKRIFEGDICRVGNLLYKVEFKHSSWWFTILSNKVYCCPAFNSHCGEYCEVIGNIHDNPDLMEG